MNIQTNNNSTALRQTPATAWLAKTKISNDASLRLFCFPYAGGGASIYRSWASRLSMVELLPV
ncbi:MAG TPA: thioesterase domain-containing protein, partial [Pyrinomonadaceae bacterium]|nr:thioesterase domain-containing protein [Pyrinomonadaceae bacterium]